MSNFSRPTRLPRYSHAFRLALYPVVPVVLALFSPPPAVHAATEALSMPVKVEAGSHPRVDRVAQLTLDLTADIRKTGFAGAIPATAFSVNEKGAPVPFQFDPDPAYDPSNKIKGLLTIFMPGTVPAGSTRTFQLEIGGDAANRTPALVSRQTGLQDEGLDAWLIKTRGLEWWWDVEAAAFISIHDPEGKDWVGFSPTPGSKGAGEFRGYPNVAVAKASKGTGNFHPGYTGAATARVVAEGPVRLAVEATTSLDQPFTLLWEFFPAYARARVVRNEIESPFWWLYEGTPGGEFGPFKAILSDGSTAGGQLDMPDPEWTYYDSPNSGHVMYFTHTPADDVVELYTTHSKAMALFGMGRGRDAPKQRLSPDLGHEFLTGFVKSKDFETVKRHILSGMEDLRVTAGPVQLQPASRRTGTRAAAGRATTGGSKALRLRQQTVADTAGNRAIGDFNGDMRNDIAVIQPNDSMLVTYAWPDWEEIHRMPFPEVDGYNTYRADNMAGADIDGDGDMDIAGRLGPRGAKNNATGSIVWWEQHSPARWTQHVVGNSPGYAKDIFIIDLDGDGKRDIVTREHTFVRFYRQENPTSWTMAGELSIPTRRGEGMAIHDIDGDGDPDAVVPKFWYENPGAMNSEWPRHTIDEDYSDDANVGVGDINGDGRPDVAMGASEDTEFPMVWYSATDPKGRWTRHVVEEHAPYFQNMQVADLDQDGDADLVSGSFPNRRLDPPHLVSVYVNADGRGGSWEKFRLTDEGQYHLIVGDVGSDGDLDIVGPASHNRAPISIWENLLAPKDGAKNTTEGGTLTIDGDDRNYRNGDAAWPRAKNTGALDRWTYHQIDTERSQRFFGIDAADVNGDGRLDLVSGHYAYVNDGNVTKEWPRHDLPKDHDTIALTDVDGDAFADVITVHPDQYGIKGTEGDVCWVEATNREGTEWRLVRKLARITRVDHAVGTQGYRAVDMFGDEREEFLYTLDNIVHVLVPPEDPETGEWRELDVATGGRLSGVGYGDFDGDGLVDAIGNLDRNNLYWYKNPGTPSDGWQQFKIADLPLYWPDQVRTGDMDGDGDIDAVIVQEVAALKDGPTESRGIWLENPGGSAQSGWKMHEFMRQYSTNALDLADMDGDGDLDPVTGEHRGPQRLIIWENDGRGNLTPHEVHRGVDQHAGARTWDVDGDGDLDIVSLSWSGFQTLHLWINGAR